MPNFYRPAAYDDILRRLSTYADDGIKGRVIDVAPDGVAKITSRKALESNPYLRSFPRMEAPVYVNPDGVASRTPPVSDMPPVEGRGLENIEDYFLRFFAREPGGMDLTR